MVEEGVSLMSELTRIVRIAKKFKNSIEHGRTNFSNKSDLETTEILEHVPALQDEKLVLADKIVQYDSLVKIADPSDLLFILEVHLQEAYGQLIEHETYVTCAEIYARLAAEQGISDLLKHLIPGSDNITEEELYEIKEKAPNFVALLSM